MFTPKQLEKFTNYNGYIVGRRRNAYEIDAVRLANVIGELRKLYKNPYIRFMWVSDAKEAMCVTYSDLKKNERVTKLSPFSELEFALKYKNLTRQV